MSDWDNFGLLRFPRRFIVLSEWGEKRIGGVRSKTFGYYGGDYSNKAFFVAARNHPTASFKTT
jgi:hypothetical protein